MSTYKYEFVLTDNCTIDSHFLLKRLYLSGVEVYNFHSYSLYVDDFLISKCIIDCKINWPKLKILTKTIELDPKPLLGSDKGIIVFYGHQYKIVVETFMPVEKTFLYVKTVMQNEDIDEDGKISIIHSRELPPDNNDPYDDSDDDDSNYDDSSEDYIIKVVI